MTETYNPLDVQFAFLDVKKDWDIDIKFDYDASYDLKVDIDKTVFEFVYLEIIAGHQSIRRTGSRKALTGNGLLVPNKMSPWMETPDWS